MEAPEPNQWPGKLKPFDDQHGHGRLDYYEHAVDLVDFLRGRVLRLLHITYWRTPWRRKCPAGGAGGRGKYS